MTDVEQFIYEYEGEQQKILRYFHGVLTNLNLSSKLGYQIPFYYHIHRICYLNPTKNGGIELAFIRGNELSNDQGILQQKDRKMITGIEFFKFEEIPQDEVLTIIHEAILLDETVPLKMPRKSK